MLTSLRETISERLPYGLTEEATQRLQRTLKHYTTEVTRVQGFANEQDILRETYDSIVNWFRRNTTHLTPTPVRTPNHTPIQMSTSIESLENMTEPPKPDEAINPIFFFERMKAEQRVPSPIRIPEIQPISLPSQGPAQQKDFLQRQEDVIKYRETEHNLIINSKDRDWLRGTAENRYNFTIHLDGGTRPQGKNVQATLTNRFRNITRIEFIKAILPVEGLEVVIPRNSSGTNVPDQAFVSTLALPYVQIMMDETTGNNYGTNPTIDKSLAICQYDATWRTDVVSGSETSNRGYTLFFPKFMKAQRVFSPAPLATMQKMSFQILNAENQPLSVTSDAATIQTVFFGSDIANSSQYADPSSEYIFIQMKDWFPLWSFSQLDRIAISGLTFPTAVSPSIQAGCLSMIRWLEREEGHIVVSTGCLNGIVYTEGANACGYTNTIIVRNRFVDPTSGGCTRDLFDDDDESILASLLTQGAALNLSRQVQLVLRIITREVDSASNVRPDNV